MGGHDLTGRASDTLAPFCASKKKTVTVQANHKINSV
jgi:hypothetical protein